QGPAVTRHVRRGRPRPRRHRRALMDLTRVVGPRCDGFGASRYTGRGGSAAGTAFDERAPNERCQARIVRSTVGATSGDGFGASRDIGRRGCAAGTGSDERAPSERCQARIVRASAGARSGDGFGASRYTGRGGSAAGTALDERGPNGR